MNFEELNEKAKEIAQKNLEHGFDWQSFIVYSVANMNDDKKNKDLVPESGIDESIQELLSMFVGYANAKRNYCANGGGR